MPLCLTAICFNILVRDWVNNKPVTERVRFVSNLYSGVVFTKLLWRSSPNVRSKEHFEPFAI